MNLTLNEPDRQLLLMLTNRGLDEAIDEPEQTLREMERMRARLLELRPGLDEMGGTPPFPLEEYMDGGSGL